VAIKRWIPPAVVDTLESALPRRLQRFEVVDSWDDAERRCLGYEQSTLKDTEVLYPARTEKSYGPTSRDVQFIAALGICLEASQPGPRVRVLDFGGALGHYYDTAASAFPTLAWEWVVVETPAMVQVSAGADNGRSISWTSDLDQALAETWDFVLASGSLNYVPDPIENLTRLCGRTPYTLITRLPLWPVEHHLPVVQRRSRRDRAGIYPTWVFSEADFLKEIRAIGDVVFRFDVPDDTARISGHRGTYSGLLIRTRDPS